MAKKHFIGADDLWKIKRPGSPTLSPDGAQACVSLTSWDMEANTASSQLWLLSTFGGEPRALTHCGEKDATPRWSPDGRHIAFVAKRGDDVEAQIYLIAPDGGEARRLTTLATGVSAIKWLADGRQLAFISWVWPDLKTNKAQATRVKARADDKCKAMVIDRTQYRYWDHWLADGRVPHVHLVAVAGKQAGKCRDLFAGTAWELPVFDTDASDFDFSADGRTLVFNFNPNADDRRADQPCRLIEIELASGKSRDLTAKSTLHHHHPTYSPDGRWVALLVNNYQRSFDDDNKLALIERKSGKLRIISATWDRNVNAPLKWAHDSEGIYFSADEHARVGIWRQRVQDPLPTQVVPGGTVSEFDVGVSGLVCVRNHMSAPPQVQAAGLDGSELRPIEQFNEDLMSRFRLGEVKEFTVKGWNGEPVQMWAIYPPNFDAKKRWPLLHSIHGGPHANWGDNFHFRWNNHVFAAQGYVVVCVNYHGSLGWGNAFLESNNGSWGDKEHTDVEAGSDFMLQQGYIDPTRLAATGGSYGGKMVAWMNGRNGAKKGGDRYRAYVCHAGCFDWVGMMADDVPYYFQHSLKAAYWNDPDKVAAQNPLTFARHMKTPTLVMHGLLDYRVPDAQGLAYYNTLKALKVPARLVFFPDENHWILKPQNSRLWYREYFAWLDKWVGAGGRKKTL